MARNAVTYKQDKLEVNPGKMNVLYLLVAPKSNELHVDYFYKRLHEEGGEMEKKC